MPRNARQMASKYPPREDIGHDQPLRLAVAAALAFPDGSMTASGLRKEAGRGRLAIERMRELCRQNPKVRDCGSEKQDETRLEGSRMVPSGSFSMENIKRAQSA